MGIWTAYRTVSPHKEVNKDQSHYRVDIDWTTSLVIDAIILNIYIYHYIQVRILQ